MPLSFRAHIIPNPGFGSKRAAKSWLLQVFSGDASRLNLTPMVGAPATVGTCKFLVETPAVRPEFNSDGWRSRYRSAASRLPTTSMAILHRNVQDIICDAGGYDMFCTQFKKHLPPRPWKENEACEALTILRSGSESNTARSFFCALGESNTARSFFCARARTTRLGVSLSVGDA